MQLSRREKKYRTKFIQECHYNKAEQKILDRAKNHENVTYKQLYIGMKNGRKHWFMLEIVQMRFAMITEKVSTDAISAAMALNALAETMRKE